MANRSRKAKQSTLWSEFSTPLLMLAAFVLGAGGMWVIMYSSAPDKPPAVTRFAPTPASPSAAEPPDVSQLTPAEAARTLADWNYDRQNWSHAIEHYQEAIARGADNADVRTDLGNCFRFLGQAQKALEQYELAQKQNPQHENSLFNQAGLYAEVLHDDQRALSIAREFLTRFPQSPRAQSAKELISRVENNNKNLTAP
ncbi:MAG: tetratricopeptide repeat protein [Chthoniobacterales bacterium]